MVFTKIRLSLMQTLHPFADIQFSLHSLKKIKLTSTEFVNGALCGCAVV